jgi:hypothetical protein
MALGVSYGCMYVINSYYLSRLVLTISTIYTFYYLDLEINFRIICIILSNMIIDAFMIMEWYKHLTITTGILIIFNCVIPSIPFLILEVVIYSLYELLLKRSWVLKDTSK